MPKAKINLKIFDGFALDMASDVCGLNKHEIRYLLDQKILNPGKSKSGSYQYSFSELLLLRLVRYLKLNRVSVKNIKRARDYIKYIDPTKDLTNYKLYIRTDNREILYLGEKPQECSLVNASKFGQLVLKGLGLVMPVGKDLEHMKRNVIDLDSTLATRIRSKKFVSADEVLKRYGAC